MSGQSYSSGRGRHISHHASVDVGIVHDAAASDVPAAGFELWLHESYDIRTWSEERRNCGQDEPQGNERYVDRHDIHRTRQLIQSEDGVR